jgi:2-methylisocitrate lyase-like PEP mutase family enzyme
MSQKVKAETFRALHAGGRILVLVNAWDAGSAKIVAAAGAAAIATTSAGVANALGYPDGERISRDVMIGVIANIVRAVDLPVSADIESGYGPAPEDAAETARQVLAAGAVGVNLEDGTGDAASPLFPIAEQQDRIRAIREVAAAQDVPLLINARTDVYLGAVGDLEGRFDEAVRRSNAYREAGADCLFVPAVTDSSTIAALVRAIDGPVNVLAGPGSPPVAELERLGVARVSTGSAFMRACYSRAGAVAAEIFGSGSWDGLVENAVSYREMNALMARK